MIDINNLGTFASVDALWAAHPEGGHEGDYATVDGVKYQWNKYDRIWENASTTTQSTARQTQTFGGDVVINNNLTVGNRLKVNGLIQAKGIKQPNRGLFLTIAELRAAYPSPEIGDWATVGNTVPAEVWVCQTPGIWTDTGQTGGIDAMDFSAIDALQTSVSLLESALDTLMEGDVSSAIDNFNEVIDFLSGVEDDESLVSLLTNLENKDTQLTNAIAAVNTILADGFRLRGLANAATNPGTPSGRVAYIVTSAGTYSNFLVSANTPATVADNEIALLMWAGGTYWSKVTLDIAKKSVINAVIDELEDTISALQTSINTTIQALASRVTALENPKSIYNPTIEAPLTQGYYSLYDQDNADSSALNVAKSNNKAVLGLIISFMSEAGKWKTYQYVGSDVEDINWFNTENWKDFGAQEPGSENYIIIESVVGAPSGGSFYTLETAIQALITFQNNSGISYAKKGLIIGYVVAENQMETKQFQGEISDFNEPSLWKDFGGGGSQVETSDRPVADGEDAFSTGGAYDLIPTGIEEIESERTDSSLKIHLINAAGDEIGDPVTIPTGTGGGGGGSGAKIVSVNFEHSPFYAAAGGSFLLKAAIRSVVTQGSDTTSETIESITITDRDTNQVLYSNRAVNQPSSDDSEDYSFQFDLSSFFLEAGSRRLRLTATDTAGDTGSRTITVVAVDVTVQTPDSLNANYVLTTDASKSISLYKFPNNQSDQGIRATVKILISGVWKTLGTAVVHDTYTHNITVNPNNVAGAALTHGSYLLKIQGEDVASGTLGNIIYSSLMVVNPQSNVPVVAIRYNDQNNGEVKLYETVKIDVAVYNNSSAPVSVTLKRNSAVVSSFEANKSRTYSINQQIADVASDGTATLVYIASAGNNAQSGAITLLVQGSAIDAALTSGAAYNFDFATRSNQEASHAIESGDFSIVLNGVNWSSNGFANYLGQTALRIAENVTGVLNHAPFANSAIENTGMAIQFAFATTHIADDSAKLLECYDPNNGAGFYITGKKIAIFCKNGVDNLVERSYPNGEIVTVGIVVEPGDIFIGRNGTRYSMMKLFINGEEAGCLGYVPGGSNLYQARNITFNGQQGDFYLYWIIGWNNYVEWQQAFYNYLVKVKSTPVMVAEYDFENVFPGSTINGPSASELLAKGMPYLVEAPYNGSDVKALDNTTSTSQKNYITLYYYDPEKPWRSFVATDVQRRNQGTTSAKRPIKNARYYLAKSKGSGKNTTVTPLYPDYDNEDALLTYQLFALNKVRVGDNTIPVDIITVKVDYSDSSNANDCGACNMMNATYRMLGANYLTPVQRFFNGHWDSGDVHLTGLQLNHSTANHPIAMYRSETGTLSDLVFYAKGNWKEDKGEQLALGFNDTPGYNLGCKNYGDFVEFFGLEDETLIQVKTRFLSNNTVKDTSKLYLLSLYCGSSYIFMRYDASDGWYESTGSMRQVNGQWVVTGDVLNPVEGFELITYQGFDWFQGVDSVETMMEMKADKSSWVQKLVDGGDISADTFPAWTYYFECMVDNDQLAIDYALGKKVPYNLYRFLRFCDSCDYSKVTGWQTIWQQNLYKYANPYALFAYNAFTDYLAAVDQQAKNMQPMWFLDDGGTVNNGVYNDEKYLRMYPNKIYDADSLLGKDNDGGATVDAEVDPNKPSDQSTGYANPYAGWGSVLWNNIYRQQSVYIDAAGNEISMRTVVAAMRTGQITVDDLTLRPFSPEGAKHFFVDNILKRWQKTVSSFDGEKKFISFTETADALYYYALHGLRLTAIPDFIDKRFKFRDGFYQTGLFFDGVVSARVNAAAGTKITIKAAKTGYFGIGNDASGNLSESCYLEAGEEYEFTNFSHQEGALLYIYQCNRMSELDLSEISISSASFDALELIEKLKIGSTTHQNLTIGGYAPLTSLPLGEMPFLQELDIRNTLVSSVNASGCPRLTKVYAEGSQLSAFTAAETSPIDTLHLPATVSELVFVNLPNLTYPGGLTMAGKSNITALRIEGCPNIKKDELLADVLTAGAQISRLRLTDVNVEKSSTLLASLVQSEAKGIDSDGINIGETNKCSSLTGSWTLVDLVEDEVLASYQAYFPNLTILNAQFTMIVFSDDVTDSVNISNPDNESGYLYERDYAPSGHLLRIFNARHAVLGKYQGVVDGVGKMLVRQLNDGDRTLYAGGQEAANLKGDRDASRADEGDAYMFEPHYWYKGVNDYIHAKKYQLFSSLDYEPQDAGASSEKVMLSSLTSFVNAALQVGRINQGENVEGAIITTNSNTVYKINVAGLKMIRWPGVSGATYAAAFADSNLNMMNAVSLNSQIEFVNGDYLFATVPDGAEWLYFTAPTAIDTNQFPAYCVKCYSDNVSAIEPDWVEHEECLCGIYEANILDGLVRSISNVAPTKNVALGTILLQASNRGVGFQCVDYEMSKDVANLFYARYGTRDSQKQCGYGSNTNGVTTGATNFLGMADTINPSNSATLGYYYDGATLKSIAAVNVMGYENWQGDLSEVMSNIGMGNGASVTDSLGQLRPTQQLVMQIKMPDGNTREVKTCSGNTNGVAIVRVRNGRYMDVLPVYATGGSTSTYYADNYYWQSGNNRVVLRSGNHANAYGGVSYAYAGLDSSSANTNNGSRLAFRGKIVFAESVAEYKAAAMRA